MNNLEEEQQRRRGTGFVRVRNGAVPSPPAQAPGQETHMRRASYWLPDGHLLQVWHSPHQNCGVAEYGRWLDDALALEPTEENRLRRGDVVLVHYGVSFDHRDLSHAIQQGAFVVLCCHAFSKEVLSVPAHRRVIHRQYQGIEHGSLRLLPLGCPTYGVPPDPLTLRRRFGLPDDGIIVSTCTFLTAQKGIPEIGENLLRKGSSNVHLQLLTPQASVFRDNGSETDRVQSLCDRWKGRVTWVREFLPEAEVLDRLAASDIGFRYIAGDTGSVSAVTKQFVAARIPQVVNPSSHFADVEGGALRVGSLGTGAFADGLLRLVRDASLRKQLRRETESEYQRLNIKTVAAQYLDLFRERFAHPEGVTA